jgi:hypothetical protein
VNGAAPDLVDAAECNAPRADLDAAVYECGVVIGFMLAAGIVSAVLAAGCFVICSAAGIHAGQGAAGMAASMGYVLCFFGAVTGCLGFCLAFTEIFPGPAGTGGAPVLIPYYGADEGPRGDRSLRQFPKVIAYSLRLVCLAAAEPLRRPRWGAVRTGGPTGLVPCRLRTVAMLMPAGQRRDWLAEVASILHETAEDQRDTVRRDYLRSAFTVIFVCRTRPIRRW